MCLVLNDTHWRGSQGRRGCQRPFRKLEISADQIAHLDEASLGSPCRQFSVPVTESYEEQQPDQQLLFSLGFLSPSFQSLCLLLGAHMAPVQCSRAKPVRKIWGDTLATLKPSSWVSVCAASKLAAHRLLCACSLHLTLFGQLFPWFLFGKINFWHWHRNCLGRKPFVGRLLSKVLRNTFARGAHHETSLFFFLKKKITFPGCWPGWKLVVPVFCISLGL